MHEASSYKLKRNFTWQIMSLSAHQPWALTTSSTSLLQFSKSLSLTHYCACCFHNQRVLPKMNSQSNLHKQFSYFEGDEIFFHLAIHSFSLQSIQLINLTQGCNLWSRDFVLKTCEVVGEKRDKHAHLQLQSKENVIMHQEMCKLFREISRKRSEFQMRGLKQETLNAKWI